MDEENTVPAENNTAVEDNSQDTSPVDEQTTSDSTGEQATEAETSSAEESSEETKSESTESERKPSRAEKRIRQLNDRVKQAGYSNQVSPFMQPPQIEIQPGQEVSPEDYRQHVVQEAQAIANQTVEARMGQERAITNFEHDTQTLVKEFPELDDSSTQYTPELEEAISQEFQEKAFQVVGFDPVTGEPQYQLNPSVRLSDIAKRYVNGARALAKKTSADMRNSVAKTADTSAIKPSSGQPPAEKDMKDMSITELEAKLGFHKQ